MAEHHRLQAYPCCVSMFTPAVAYNMVILVFLGIGRVGPCLSKFLLLSPKSTLLGGKQCVLLDYRHNSEQPVTSNGKPRATPSLMFTLVQLHWWLEKDPWNYWISYFSLNHICTCMCYLPWLSLILRSFFLFVSLCFETQSLVSRYTSLSIHYVQNVCWKDSLSYLSSSRCAQEKLGNANSVVIDNG